jgi:hypothetical protein
MFYLPHLFARKNQQPAICGSHSRDAGDAQEEQRDAVKWAKLYLAKAEEFN